MEELYAIALVVLAFLIWRFTYVVSEGEVVILERLGKYYDTLGPGLHFVIPLINTPKTIHWQYRVEQNGRISTEVESTYRLDTKDKIYDPPAYSVVSQDHVMVQINVVIIFYIDEPKKAVYGCDDILQALEQISSTSLRQSASSLTFEGLISQAEQIKVDVQKKCAQQFSEWGIIIKRVEIQNITGPKTVMEATERTVATERAAKARFAKEQARRESEMYAAQTQQELQLKRVETNKKISELEADQKLYVLRKNAEAQKIVETIKAEAYEQKRGLQAQADADYYKALLDSGISVDYLTQKLHAESWEVIAEKSKSIVVPYEASKFLGGASLANH